MRASMPALRSSERVVDTGSCCLAAAAAAAAAWVADVLFLVVSRARITFNKVRDNATWMLISTK